MRLAEYAPDSYGRAVLAAYETSLSQAVAQLRAPSEHFILCIACDALGIPRGDLVDFAAAFIRAGAAYVCCWGPDCERLHDCFDEADAIVNGEASDSRVLMTTWHADESLEESLWYALNSTFPASHYQDRTKAVIIVSIGDHGWYERVTTYLEAGAPMLDEA